MKVKSNRYVSILLIICIIGLFISFHINVDARAIYDKKHYCNASIDDNFADDSILVVLKGLVD